ncbi:hypothetical protein FACS1894141_5870 [Spirochaetia bacterium]|nr:hypothetical protein FACS1894141_5870 [Spirochaetia bacterium]
MGKGQCFLDQEVETRRGKIRHLNVIISNADADFNSLVVPITTWYEINGRPIPTQDNSCVLPPDCHPFIKHKSYAKYKMARSLNSIDLANGLFKGEFIKQQDMSVQYVQDLQRGAEASPYLPDQLKRFFDYFL